MSRPFGYYYFDGYKVDVFGYDRETDTYDYAVETPYSSKVRKAAGHYVGAGKNEWRYPPYTYINIIDPTGKKKKLKLDN